MFMNHPQAGIDLIKNIKQLDEFKPIKNIIMKGMMVKDIQVVKRNRDTIFIKDTYNSG